MIHKTAARAGLRLLIAFHTSDRLQTRFVLMAPKRLQDNKFSFGHAWLLGASQLCADTLTSTQSHACGGSPLARTIHPKVALFPFLLLQHTVFSDALHKGS